MAKTQNRTKARRPHSAKPADTADARPIVLHVVPLHTTGRGQWFRVERDGITLVPRSRDPEHDAARALHSIGVRGTFQTYFGTRTYPSCRPRDIAQTAIWTVSEEAARGVVRRKWSPMDAKP